jgi:hypothetical protein
MIEALPEDIMILIFSQCRIDDLLTLRLTNRKIKDIIAEYIVTIAPSVARQTFPASNLLLQPLSKPTDYSLGWLKFLIPQQLAAILVDRHRFSLDWTQQRYGIPAEDSYGDELRARVANGWCVLRKLSNISKEVYAMSPRNVLKSTDMALSVVRPSKYKFELFRQREELILKRRLQFIKEISDDMTKDYKLMFVLLSSAFRTSLSNYGDDFTPWIFDWGCGIDGQRLLRRGNSWLTWFVLEAGPELFWQQWWALPPDTPATKNYIRDKSLAAWFGDCKTNPEDFVRQFLPREWNDVNEKWHSVQRDNAYEVQKAIEEKVAASVSGDFSSVNPLQYFVQYAEVREQREQLTIPPVVESMSHVPFHVDFRCPEELFQKFCTLREERAGAAASPPRSESFA